MGNVFRNFRKFSEKMYNNFYTSIGIIEKEGKRGVKTSLFD